MPFVAAAGARFRCRERGAGRPKADETFDVVARPRYVEYVTRALHARTTPAEIRPQSATRGLFGAIGVPTLVVAGVDDRAPPPPLAAGVAGVRLALLPHSGHLPVHDEPAVFAALLLGLADGAP